MINYHNKFFRTVQNSSNGETSSATIFKYEQRGNIVSSSYSGGKVLKGHLIGLVSDDGKIEMRYHQINTAGELRTGICRSTPELLPNGKIRLHEEWEWTGEDSSKGTSMLDEM